jgi:pantoate--beta-alanine ligase
MIIFNTKGELSTYLNGFNSKSAIVGFVPTMGALHPGHISLIEIAKNQCDLVVCSIFVNPTQFNDMSDLDKYPRTLEADIHLLESAKCDVLFAPEISEIYTNEELLMKKNHIEDTSWMDGHKVDFDLLDKVMEGALRPGHYNGVAQVVSKLFKIVKPMKAYFGQKDFQQYTIIRSMVKQMEMPIEIISCPIIREADGLAMSSRNIRITSEERKSIPVINNTLQLVKAMSTLFPIAELKGIVENTVPEKNFIELEYFEIVDAETLQPITDLQATTSAVACIAVKLSKVRLIDNIVLK